MPHEGFAEITFMESVASRRLVYLSAYSASRMTMSTLTNEQNGQPKLYFGGTINISTTSTLRGADTANGLYYLVLTQSECSAAGLAGPARLRYSSNSCQETTVNINFTKHDSADSMRFGAFAVPNVAPAAAGGLPTFGTGTGQLNVSGGSVGLVPAVMSGVSVEVKTGGIQTASVGVGNYSGVSVGVLDLKPGLYSGVTVSEYISQLTLQSGSATEIRLGSTETVTDDWYNGWNVQVQYPSGFWVGNVISDYTGSNKSCKLTNTLITAPTSGYTYRLYPMVPDIDPSITTIKGIANYANISNVTLAAGTHSNVTIQGVTRLNSGVTLNAGVHSGASVEIKAGGIQSSSYGAGAIDAVALATDAGQEIADRLLSRNVAGGSDGGRTVYQSLAPLRNKVAIDGSTITIYDTDDATSLWTGTVTTGTNPISGVDPNGP